MSHSISTLLLRNLDDVFGEIDPVRRRAAIIRARPVPTSKGSRPNPVRLFLDERMVLHTRLRREHLRQMEWVSDSHSATAGDKPPFHPRSYAMAQEPSASGPAGRSSAASGLSTAADHMSSQHRV
jgi:hypothetical protein